MSTAPQYFDDPDAARYPATLEEIYKIEETCHIQFPDFLRQYYQVYDAIPVRRCNFQFIGTHFCLVNLMTIAPGKFNIEALLKNEEFRETIPGGWIPLGIDIHDNYFFYDPITEAVFLLTGEKRVPELAAFSLSDFFEALNHSSPDPIETGTQIDQ